jgi:hypothetical protein
MEKYVYSMVAEVMAVAMAVVVPALPLRLIQVTLVVNRLAAAVDQLVMHQTLVVLLAAAVVIREFLLGILLRPTGVQ